MKVVVVVEVQTVRSFALPEGQAIVVTVDEGATVTHATAPRTVRSDEALSGVVEFGGLPSEPFRFPMTVNAGGPSPIRVCVRSSGSDVVLGTGAVPWRYQLHTAVTVVVPCVNDGLVHVGTVELRVSVEKAAHVVVHRPSMPFATDTAMWPGTLRLQIRSVHGVYPPEPNGPELAMLEKGLGFVTIQFGAHNRSTSRAAWVLKSAGYTASWPDGLTFDIVPHQSRQITFTLHTANGSADTVLSSGTMNLVLPAGVNKTSHTATQTVSLNQEATLTVVYEQTYVQPGVEGASGRPKSAYHRPGIGQDPKGTRPGTATSWDSEDDDLPVPVVRPQAGGHGRPMTAKVQRAPPSAAQGGRPGTAAYPQKLRGTIEERPDDIEVIDMDAMDDGVVPRLRRDVQDQQGLIQELMATIDTLQETVARQQSLIESLQRSQARPASGESAQSRPSSAASVERPLSGTRSAARAGWGESTPLQGLSEAHLRAKFAEYDPSYTGFISREQLRQFYQSYDTFGLIEDERTIEKFLSKYARGTGRLVSFDDFAQLTLKLAQR